MASNRWRVIAAGLAVLLLSSGAVCCGSSNPDPSATPTGPQAKDYLPDPNILWSAQLTTGHYEFEVDPTELTRLADPIGLGIELVEDAIGDTDAPRRFAPDTGTTNKFLSAAQLAASAIDCLHKHNHLELYVYVDKRHLYSLALVLIINIEAYRDLNVSLCVVKDLLPIPDIIVIPYQPTPPPPRPTLDPCVGASRQDSYVRLWLGTTDAMCGALGQSVPPPSNRSVRLGDQGPEVTFLQYHLNQVGFKLNVDGIFGSDTETALKQFQRCQPNAGTNGIADGATRTALIDAEKREVKCS